MDSFYHKLSQVLNLMTVNIDIDFKFKSVQEHSFEEKVKNFNTLIRIIDIPNKEQIILNKYLVSFYFCFFKFISLFIFILFIIYRRKI